MNRLSYLLSKYKYHRPLLNYFSPSCFECQSGAKPVGWHCCIHLNEVIKDETLEELETRGSDRIHIRGAKTPLEALEKAIEQINKSKGEM